MGLPGDVETALEDSNFLGIRHLDKYITDFIVQNKLVIELMVLSITNSLEYDKIRKIYSFGHKTIRFNNLDVFKNLDEVMERVYDEVRKSSNSLLNSYE